MVTVRDNPGEERYEVFVDGALTGFAQYRARGDLLAFIHTEIEPGHEGEGLGSELVRAALEDVRTRGLAILPFCPFVRDYLARHDEYLDLVPVAHRPSFEL